MPLLFLSPLHRATRQIGIFLAGRMSALGLQNPEGHLLTFLRSYAPAPISELVRVFGFKKSTLTSLLDRLERRGLVRREHNPRDRRSVLVHLTDDGRRVADEVQQHVEDLERRIRSEIRDGDLRGFRRVLDGIAQATAVEVRTKRKESE